MTTIEVWYAISLFVLTSGSYLTRLSPRKRYQLPLVGVSVGGVLFLLLHVAHVKPNPFWYMATWATAAGCSFMIVWAINEYRRQRVRVG